MSRDIKYIGMKVHKEATMIAVLNLTGKVVMESMGRRDLGGLIIRLLKPHVHHSATEIAVIVIDWLFEQVPLSTETSIKLSGPIN